MHAERCCLKLARAVVLSSSQDVCVCRVWAYFKFHAMFNAWKQNFLARVTSDGELFACHDIKPAPEATFSSRTSRMKSSGISLSLRTRIKIHFYKCTKKTFIHFTKCLFRSWRGQNLMEGANEIFRSRYSSMGKLSFEKKSSQPCFASLLVRVPANSESWQKG